ncbi:hypothetical protein, partial [Klebsiella pneumoniae]|uniref:hypothetical protein n=1 Tax=Klebsiella pneumoniae TaxID=573 RepID=UPI001C62E533
GAADVFLDCYVVIPRCCQYFTGLIAPTIRMSESGFTASKTCALRYTGLKGTPQSTAFFY